ncbi:dihydrofolate reductase [Echinicola pacifica]|uniref:Dihydrofolate reductase n=1 Tax=Echinicola pacifica TaxID=346377 RepID=A0A918UKN4_9BACT|nr:dihydrofolate reductase family protein [Echinicola pacifica]GGZ16779.1 dihydrofolate reductase [Echinicola pacifica]
MKCSVFIATSTDGYIARPDGAVDWLHSAGNGQTIEGDKADMGFQHYISSVDCMIMGRKTMQTISSMDLSPDQWIYGDLRIIVLSQSLKEAPENLRDKVELYHGDLQDLLASLEAEGFHHAYIDGGATIQSFLSLQLINEMTITLAPILLGEGIPLFGKTGKDIHLQQAESTAFANDFVQVKYKVNYK